METACQALLTYSARFADALEHVGDPAVRAVGVWSIAETAVHVSQSSPYFLAAARGRAQLEDVSDNAATTVRSVAEEPERDLRVLAGRIVHGERDLVAYARAAGGDPPVTPFAGLEVPLSSMLGIELGELLVRGFDVTRAAGLPWPIQPADAALALGGGLRVLPLLLDTRRAAGLKIRLKLHIRHGSPLVIVIDNEALRVEPGGRPAGGLSCLGGPGRVPARQLPPDQPGQGGAHGQDHHLGPQTLAAAKIAVSPPQCLTSTYLPQGPCQPHLPPEQDASEGPAAFDAGVRGGAG